VKYAEYVIGGWVLTGAVIGAYWVRLIQRTKRAERLDREP
jgi:NhaP-type Na+/H+ or K+/H+ antiporter